MIPDSYIVLISALTSVVGLFLGSWSAYLTGRPPLIPETWSPPTGLEPEDHAWIARHLELAGATTPAYVTRSGKELTYVELVRRQRTLGVAPDGIPGPATHAAELRARAESFGTLRTRNSGPL